MVMGNIASKRVGFLLVCCVFVVGLCSLDSLGASEKAEKTDLSADVAYQPMVPRWQLPPISNPYFIMWNRGPTQSQHKKGKVMGSNFREVMLFETQTMEEGAHVQDLPWWYGRGIMASAKWYGGTQNRRLSTIDDFVNQFLTAIKNGEVGVILDELVGFDSESQKLSDNPEKKKGGNPKNSRLAEACRIIKEKYPDFFIVVYSHMQSDSMVEAIKAGWIDLNVIMSYVHWPGSPAWNEGLALWRLNNAKKAGVMEKSIPCIGIYKAPNKVINVESIEKWIKYYRKHFPQMPGVCFYPGIWGSLTAEQHSLRRQCDRLVKKYYIDPAPKVTITKPIDGEIIAGSVHIKAKADKAVMKWRLYVGSRKIAENESGEFKIDKLSQGPHIVTVHAITSDWLRAAEQIQIQVTKK